MSKQPKKPDNRHPGRGGNNVSLHPLTLEQALKAALKVKPADLKKAEEEEAKSKQRKSRGK